MEFYKNSFSSLLKNREVWGSPAWFLSLAGVIEMAGSLGQGFLGASTESA
jgi:hypothetical protein